MLKQSQPQALEILHRLLVIYNKPMYYLTGNFLHTSSNELIAKLIKEINISLSPTLANFVIQYKYCRSIGPYHTECTFSKYL